MIQGAASDRDDRVKRWELNLLLVESIFLGGLGFAALSGLGDALPRLVMQAAGFLLLMLLVFPGIRALTRRQGYEIPISRYIAFAILGAVVGAGVLVLIEWVS